MRRWVWLPLLYVMIYYACADQRASAVTDVLRTVLEQTHCGSHRLLCSDPLADAGPRDALLHNGIQQRLLALQNHARRRGIRHSGVEQVNPVVRAVGTVWQARHRPARDLQAAASCPPVAGHVCCAASRLVSSRGAPVRRQARGAAPRRNPAPQRRSTPPAQRRTDSLGATRPSPRADLPSANSGLAQRGPRFLGMDRIASTRLDYLQMRQQSLAGRALQEGRAVIWEQESRDRQDRDLPR
jgi:hypothetical protein